TNKEQTHPMPPKPRSEAPKHIFFTTPPTAFAHPPSQPIPLPPNSSRQSHHIPFPPKTKQSLHQSEQLLILSPGPRSSRPAAPDVQNTRVYPFGLHLQRPGGQPPSARDSGPASTLRA